MGRSPCGREGGAGPFEGREGRDAWVGWELGMTILFKRKQYLADKRKDSELGTQDGWGGGGGDWA